MEEVLKSRSRFYNILTFAFVLITPLICVGVLYLKTGSMPKLWNFGKSPVHAIEVGADLSQYEGEKVSCTVRNLTRKVVGIYKPDDPTEEIFTQSYLATDSNFENPSLIFFPMSKSEQLEDMCDKTWNEMDGKYEVIIPIYVEGYVHKLHDSLVHHYLEAIDDMYGEGASANVTDVYFIDDENVFRGEPKNDDSKILLIIIAIIEPLMLISWLMTIYYSKKIPKVIESFLIENKVNRLELERLFSNTHAFNKTLWASPELTVGYDGVNCFIVFTENIAKIDVKRQMGKRVTYKIKFYSKYQEKCGQLVVANPTDIIDYYSYNFPDILVNN